MYRTKGQSMIEYLIITSIVSIATIGVVKLISHTVRSKFAQINYSIQGKSLQDINAIKFKNIDSKNFEVIGMEDFYETTDE